jgi:hypothetical protein
VGIGLSGNYVLIGTKYTVLTGHFVPHENLATEMAIMVCSMLWLACEDTFQLKVR